MWCLSHADCCVLFVGCFVVRCLWLVARLLFAMCRVVFIIAWCPPVVVDRFVFVYCALYDVCCLMALSGLCCFILDGCGLLRVVCSVWFMVYFVVVVWVACCLLL